MSKKSRARRQRKKVQEREIELLHCPVCRKNDRLVDNTETPQLTECRRCAVQFFIEEVVKEEPDAEVAVSTPKSDTKFARTTEPVVGNMVELTGVGEHV